MKQRKKVQVWLPLLFSIVMIIGMVIGYKLRDNTQVASNVFKFSTKRSPLQEVLDLVMMKYVDKVDVDTLGNSAIQDMLMKLDPHSNFIPARHLGALTEDLQGNFQGIGIEFQLFRDTVNVVNVVPGGPSEKAGLQVGDKFLKVGDTTVTGKISTDRIKELLRGPGGSVVTTTILRNGQPETIKITRGTIPLPSLDASYLIEPGTGYMRISKFSETTYEEFMAGLEKLQAEGMKSLILDLRGNGGGILGEAIDMADEFLDGDKLIVYTEGNTLPRQEYRARRAGLFEKGKLILLMDEQSASASEVLAGALQDWDRATIIGRRSFGKGLVQEQYQLSDGSALRLTVARYYTPSGRSIQKPYDKGVEQYQDDLHQRYVNGEMVSADSIHASNGKEYKTSGGRVVYGGGGIVPDQFVGADTTLLSSSVTDLYRNNTIGNYTYLYYVRNRQAVDAYPTPGAYNQSIQFTENDWAGLKTLAEQDSIKISSFSAADRAFLSERMKALIARYRWRSNGYFQVLNAADEMVEKARKEMKEVKGEK
jgi:carboxyl-terminal processing protease